MRRDANYEISKDFNCFLLPPPWATWQRINCIPFDRQYYFRLCRIFVNSIAKLQNWFLLESIIYQMESKETLKYLDSYNGLNYYKSNLRQELDYLSRCLEYCIRLNVYYAVISITVRLRNRIITACKSTLYVKCYLQWNSCLHVVVSRPGKPRGKSVPVINIPRWTIRCNFCI